MNHWKQQELESRTILFETVNGGTDVKGILFDELHYGADEGLPEPAEQVAE